MATLQAVAASPRDLTSNRPRGINDLIIDILVSNPQLALNPVMALENFTVKRGFPLLVKAILNHEFAT